MRRARLRRRSIPSRFQLGRFWRWRAAGLGPREARGCLGVCVAHPLQRAQIRRRSVAIVKTQRGVCHSRDADEQRRRRPRGGGEAERNREDKIRAVVGDVHCRRRDRLRRRRTPLSTRSRKHPVETQEGKPKPEQQRRQPRARADGLIEQPRQPRAVLGKAEDR
eukprot:Amastigsp_a692_22.p5 type:complete len:164 gc:universal Amastigsp_a692_22:1271-1762(+)